MPASRTAGAHIQGSPHAGELGRGFVPRTFLQAVHFLCRRFNFCVAWLSPWFTLHHSIHLAGVVWLSGVSRLCRTKAFVSPPFSAPPPSSESRCEVGGSDCHG